MSPDYKDDKLYFSQNDDWIVIQHFKKYTEFLENIDNYMLNKIDSLDSITPDECDYSITFWNIIKEDFTTDPLGPLVQNLTTEIISCSSCLSGSENPRVIYDPTVGKVDGVFAKLVTSLDKGVGNFLQNYSMAKQVSKFECDFMEIFKQVQEIQEAIKYGDIMAYFDSIYKDFLKQYDNYTIYANYNNLEEATNLDCNTKKNLAYAYYNNYDVPNVNQLDYEPNAEPFINAINTYKTKLETGLKDLNTLLDAMDGFMDEVYIAVKVLGALNIVFYSDPADADMLEKESTSTFKSMTPPVGQDTDSEAVKATLQARTIWAMAISVPIAIEAQKYINDKRTNQATVFGSAVQSAFYNIDLTNDLNVLREVLNAQHN
jgi:hypothetical protein